MEFRDFAVEVKSLGDGGVIEGLAAVYGNVDRQQDVIMPGAFTKTLAKNGGQVPLLYQHQQDQPIGVARLVDSAQGLTFKAVLVKGVGVPEADKAWALLKAGVLRSFSIGYDTERSAMKGSIRQLQELELYEISLVTIPANELAVVTSMKHNAPELAYVQAFTDGLSNLAAEMELRSTLRQMNALARSK